MCILLFFFGISTYIYFLHMNIEIDNVEESKLKMSKDNEENEKMFNVK